MTDAPFRSAPMRRAFEPPAAPRPCPLSVFRHCAELSSGFFVVGCLTALVFGGIGLSLPYQVAPFGHQLVFGAAALMALLAAACLPFLLYVRARYVHGKAAIATITHVRDDGRRKYGHACRLRLAFEADGKVVERTLSITAHSPPTVGAELVVFYPPGKPSASLVAPLAEAEKWRVRFDAEEPQLRVDSDEPSAVDEASSPEEEVTYSAAPR